MNSATVDAWTRLLNAIVEAFGPEWALGIGAFFVVWTTFWRIYNDKRKDKDRKAVIEEKEKTIQRLAAESREYRAAIFREKFKWTHEQVEALFYRNDYKDGVEAREKLEGGKS